MYVLIADLDEDGARIGEQIAGDGEAVAEVGEESCGCRRATCRERLSLVPARG